MVTASEMLPLLVKACPSFADKWELHQKEYRDETNYLPYIALGGLAHHLVELREKGETGEFTALFATVERLHTEGESYVREAATIGLLEGIQNIQGNRGSDPEVFRSYLLPVTAKCWDQLNLFWDGKIKGVGETINECQN